MTVVAPVASRIVNGGCGRDSVGDLNEYKNLSRVRGATRCGRVEVEFDRARVLIRCESGHLRIYACRLGQDETRGPAIRVHGSQ